MRRKREQRRKLRRLKLRTLFMLSITLIFNDYAWFLYITQVSTNMQVHVDAWSVNFEIGNDTIEKNTLFTIDNAYPGMESKSQTIKITNSGEKLADISYKISKMRILGNTYIVKNELSSEEKATLTGNEIEKTNEELLNMLEKDYPFTISSVCNATQLSPGESTEATISFTWEYDSADDSLDTQFGVDSYNYYLAHKDSPAIEINIKVVAQQHKNT